LLRINTGKQKGTKKRRETRQGTGELISKKEGTEGHVRKKRQFKNWQKNLSRKYADQVGAGEVRGKLDLFEGI